MDENKIEQVKRNIFIQQNKIKKNFKKAIIKMNRNMAKMTFKHMRTIKVQVSLCCSAGSSGPLISVGIK